MNLHRYLFAGGAVVGCLFLSPLYCVEGNTTAATVSHVKASPIVRSPAGEVEGLIEGKLRIFKGIPYVLPPVGVARWKPPSPMPRVERCQKSD